jgi:EF-hand domain pair
MDARLDRIKAAFDALDTDSNGYLEADDFDRLGHRIIQALDEAEGSPKALAMHEGCRRYWEGLVGTLDLNHDGKVSWEEYAGVHEPAAYEDSVRPYADALTSICDRDDDGFVQHADFVGDAGRGLPRGEHRGSLPGVRPEWDRPGLRPRVGDRHRGVLPRPWRPRRRRHAGLTRVP